ncbi:putative Ribonuclease H2 non-catalytic subunit (Ylr154p-like) [Leishmania naiffi]|uniref:Ribonuclease H2 non-catalytic subunit (Ylr154p-like) n=1 Tax=Leishmania naiffi TaxID=5678 RepID=A0AAW3BRG2_9TRYP
MVRNSNDGLWRATLRGRALLGEEVQLPEGYAIAMTTVTTNKTFSPSSPTSASLSPFITPTAEADEIEAPDQVSIQACASRYVVWEHDKAPTAAATISQWVTLAQLIHTSSQ